MMINKKKSSNTHLSKYVFSLSVVIICCLVFGISKATDNKIIILKPVYVSFFHTTDSIKQEIVKKKKGKEAVAEEKAVSREEVVALIKDTTTRQNIRISGMQDRKPLLVIDGKPHEDMLIENINSETIESITILKESAAKSLYGNKAKDGVVVVTTREGASKEKDKKTGIDLTKKVFFSDEVMKARRDTDTTTTTTTTTRVKVRGMSDRNPLLVVDGVVLENGSLDDIVNTEAIQSFTILKEASAIALYSKLYGARVKDGVIIIVTRKGESK